MFRITQIKVIGLALAGAVVLSGGVYATAALALGGPSAPTAPTQAAPTSVEWRSAMMEMLEDHMGLSGEEAEEFADEMTDHMQGFDEDHEIQEMVDWCTQQTEAGTYGPGMMDGYGWGYHGWGMMDGDDNAYGGYGMMGEMMQGYDGPRSQENSSEYTPGEMMDDTRNNPAPGAPGSGDRDFMPDSDGMMSDGMMSGGMMGSGMMGGLGLR